MRALITSPALVVLAIFLVWCVMNRTRMNWDGAGRFLSHRAIVAYLIFGACANMFVAALAGYINPMDYVQDVVAARQFLKHETMYPANLPRLGFAELSAPMPGREALRKLSIFQGELKTATFSPAPGNAHPPVLGILLVAPVFLFGMRGSFLFILSLSVVLLYVTVAAILETTTRSLGTFGIARGAVFHVVFHLGIHARVSLALRKLGFYTRTARHLSAVIFHDGDFVLAWRLRPDAAGRRG